MKKKLTVVWVLQCKKIIVFTKTVRVCWIWTNTPNERTNERAYEWKKKWTTSKRSKRQTNNNWIYNISSADLFSSVSTFLNMSKRSFGDHTMIIRARIHIDSFIRLGNSVACLLACLPACSLTNTIAHTHKHTHIWLSRRPWCIQMKIRINKQ